MKAKTILKPTPSKEATIMQTECFVCKRSIFKTARITEDLIMLKCTNCGETHMISTQKTDKLTFWDADQQNYP
jgi:hypothetical protein